MAPCTMEEHYFENWKKKRNLARHVPGDRDEGEAVAWRGVAWRGVAWRGVAWRGKKSPTRCGVITSTLKGEGKSYALHQHGR